MPSPIRSVKYVADSIVAWCLEPGTWGLDFATGTWNLELGLGAWSLDLEVGAWNVEAGDWNLVPCRLELGCLDL